MSRRTALSTVIVLLSAACSRSDDTSPDAAADGDAPPLSCAQTHEQLHFSVVLPDGVRNCENVGSDGAPRTTQGISSGVVRSIGPDAGSAVALTIDTCVGAGCSPQDVVFNVSTPTPFTIPVGAYVAVDYRIVRPFWPCTYFLAVTNLPELNGQTNPISDIAKTYVVASDGLANPTFKIGPADVAVASKPLGCTKPDASTCSGPVDSYVFEFAAADGASLMVPMGQSLPWTVGDQNVVVRNHRSFQTRYCDDYWNWAFTVLGQ